MTIAVWIMLAVVVLGLVVLAGVLRSLGRRLAVLRTASAGLRNRAEQARALGHRINQLQPALAQLQGRIEIIGARLGRS